MLLRSRRFRRWRRFRPVRSWNRNCMMCSPTDFTDLHRFRPVRSMGWRRFFPLGVPPDLQSGVKKCPNLFRLCGFAIRSKGECFPFLLCWGITNPPVLIGRTFFYGGFQIISGWKIILGMLLYKVGFPFLRNPTSYSNMSEWSLTQISTINNH